MTIVTTRRTLHEVKAEVRLDVGFVRRMNDAHTWDTSTETVQRICDHLKTNPAEFLDG